MPLSDVHQDCQVNSGLLRLETAAADLVRQCEMTDKLVKSLLERLGPLQAENARFATQSPFQVSLTIPAPSASLAHSAPFTSSTPISVECLAPSASFTRSASSSSSACQKDPLQHFSLPEFDGNCFAGQTFYTSCRSHICSHPEAFEDDSAKIHWVMSHMQIGPAGRWATQEFDYRAQNGTFHFANWSAFAGEFQKEFMPPKAEDEAIGMLATDCYFQGKRTVSEYLDQFQDLVEDSGYTDPKTIVVKFWNGTWQTVGHRSRSLVPPSCPDEPRLCDGRHLPLAGQHSVSRHSLPHIVTTPACSARPCVVSPLRLPLEEPCPDMHQRGEQG